MDLGSLALVEMTEKNPNQGFLNYKYCKEKHVKLSLHEQKLSKQKAENKK